MRKIGLTFVLLLTAQILTAQTGQSIRGQVIDADSRNPLVAASITVLQNDSVRGGAYSDGEGNFLIGGLSPGRYSLRASYLGYEELDLPSVMVTSAREVVLTLELREKIVTGDTIEIVARKRTETRNDMATVSTRPFTIEETRRFSGSVGDPARMAMNFAGVNGANDQRNDIIIRGNSPMGVLWRMEGIDIPNPNHFATFGTSGGPIGILNNNTLANSDFMTGAFPAEYGNAVAGVFDLKMRKGNSKKHELLGQFGANGFELVAEGPFNKNQKSSYMAAYRYNNLWLFQELGLNFGSSSVPQWQDLAMKLHFPTAKIGTISVFGIAGTSTAEVLESERTPDDVYGPSGTDIAFLSNTGILGVTHTMPVGQQSYFKSTVAFTGSSMNVVMDTVDKQTLETGPFYRNESWQTKVILMTSYTQKFSARHTMKTGVFAERINFNLLDSVYLNVLGQFITLTDFDGDSWLFQPYAQWKYRANENLTFNLGVHGQFLALNNTYAVEPRAGVKWELPGRQSLSAGFGMHSQLQPIFVYFAQRPTGNGDTIMPNAGLDLMRSTHYVLGYAKELGKKFQLKTEVYYQDVTGAGIDAVDSTSWSLLNQGADFWFIAPDSMNNGGTGYNYGLEITLEKFLSENYYFLFTASLYDSKYRGSDGIVRNTAFNGGYVFNLLGGVDLPFGPGGKYIFGANGKVTTAGGRRYTPIDPVASGLAGVEVRIDSLAYSEQFQPYFRANVRLSLQANGKRVSQSIAIDLTNIFNTRNPLYQVYDVDTNTLRVINQLGFLPILQYRIEF